MQVPDYLFLCCFPCFAGCRYKNRVAPLCRDIVGKKKPTKPAEDVIEARNVKPRTAVVDKGKLRDFIQLKFRSALTFQNTPKE